MPYQHFSLNLLNIKHNNYNTAKPMTYADYIASIEIDQLWSGKHHIKWELDPSVNILSGINGVGKSTILKKVVAHLDCDANGTLGEDDGVRIGYGPASANGVRYDIIRSFDRPLMNLTAVHKLDISLATELDFQLFQLQRKYLDYQVNLGNRIISMLQSGLPDAAAQANAIAESKTRFQNIVDELFAETGKTIIRTENEIRFLQIGETLLPYQLSSGEKQMLAILLTVLVEDGQPYVLFMDEPEVSLHIEWQKKLIDTIRELNPKVQIVLTTHSPAVVMNGWMDHVTEVSDITLPIGS